MSAPTPKLVWLDLETTGLNEFEGEVLELGIIVTDLDLKEIGRKSWVFPHLRDDVIALMNDYVLNMHLSSGLLKQVWFDAQHPNDHARDQAKRKRDDLWAEAHAWLQRMVGFFKDNATPSKHCYLAGSSIHFDRSWLAVHGEKMLNLVSHRMLDVSSYKVAFPELLEGNLVPASHRALADLEYSMGQHRQVRTFLGMASASAFVAEEVKF